MHSPPRSLRFAVGTSLLGASLSLAVAGCTDAGKSRKDKVQPTVNPKEQGQPPEEEDHVNVGPEEPAPKPEPIHVNEGPPTTAADPPTAPEPESAPEEKRVNVRPTAD